VTLKPGGGHNIKFLPYAFTEHGAIMAATVLNSPCAYEYLLGCDYPASLRTPQLCRCFTMLGR
jgi:hypothetical protein